MHHVFEIIKNHFQSINYSAREMNFSVLHGVNGVGFGTYLKIFVRRSDVSLERYHFTIFVRDCAISLIHD